LSGPDRVANTIGMELPEDFPLAAYHEVSVGLTPLLNLQFDRWREWASAWNSVAYRYLAVDECDQGFRASIGRYSTSPSAPQRYQQERDLFGFFVSGLSAIESFCYGAFAMASMVDAGAFPFSTSGDKRAVTVKSTELAFERRFPSLKLSRVLCELVASAEFDEWTHLRNVLAHRGTPGRGFTRGGVDDGQAIWLRGILVDESTTANRRRWLSLILGQLLAGAAEFYRAELEKVAKP
jgi:hypothetical protein